MPTNVAGKTWTPTYASFNGGATSSADTTCGSSSYYFGYFGYDRVTSASYFGKA